MGQHLFCARAGYGSIHSPQFKRDRDIRRHAPPRQQQVSLGHVTKVTGSFLAQLAIEPNLSLLRIKQSSQQTKQRALSTTGRSDERHEFSRINMQRQVSQRLDPLAVTAEGFAYIA
jgi:phenylalanyl-tRNA synthetase beta subunit